MSAIGKAGVAGFTLIEMLVVLAILGLIGGLAYPALAPALAAQRFRNGEGQAETALRLARARALAGQARVLLRAEEVAAHLPPGLRAWTEPAGGIAFFADGSSSGGRLTLTDGARRASLAVAPVTGLIG